MWPWILSSQFCNRVLVFLMHKASSVWPATRWVFAQGMCERQSRDKTLVLSYRELEREKWKTVYSCYTGWHWLLLRVFLPTSSFYFPLFYDSWNLFERKYGTHYLKAEMLLSLEVIPIRIFTERSHAHIPSYISAVTQLNRPKNTANLSTHSIITAFYATQYSKIMLVYYTIQCLLFIIYIYASACVELLCLVDKKIKILF